MTRMQKEALIAMGADPDDLTGALSREIYRRIAGLAGRMEDELARKYPGTTFSVRHVASHSVLVRHDEFTVAASDAPDATFSVQIWEQNGTYELTDNYYGSLVQEDYEAHLRDLLAGEGIEAKVICTIDCQLGRHFDASMRLDEALGEDGFAAYAWILLTPDAADAGDRAHTVEALIASQRLWGNFTVYALSSPLPEGAHREDIFERIRENTAEAPTYTYAYGFANFNL